MAWAGGISPRTLTQLSLTPVPRKISCPPWRISHSQLMNLKWPTSKPQSPCKTIPKSRALWRTTILRRLPPQTPTQPATFPVQGFRALPLNTRLQAVDSMCATDAETSHLPRSINTRESLPVSHYGTTNFFSHSLLADANYNQQETLCV